MRRARVSGALPLVLLVGASGCPGGEPGAADATVGGDAAPMLDASVGDAPPPPCDAFAVDVVRGRVVDETGAAVERARPQLCVRAPDGRLLCLDPPFSDAEGRFEITVPAAARCMGSAAMRLLVTRGPFGTSYCPVDVTTAVAGTLELATPFELYTVTQGEVPPLGDAAMPREVPAGDVLVATLAPTEIGGESDYARLGAARLEPARSCVPDARALDGLFVVTPESRLEGAPFRILASGLPAGTSVDLFVIGGLDTVLADGTAVEEAHLARFGAGSVAADGTITPEPSTLLPQLGWLGWSATP